MTLLHKEHKLWTIRRKKNSNFLCIQPTNFCRKAKVVSLLCLIGITFKATMGCFLHSSTNWFPFSVYDPSIREQNLEQNELQRVSSNLNNTVMWLQKFRWKLFFWTKYTNGNPKTPRGFRFLQLKQMKLNSHIFDNYQKEKQ